MSCMNSCENCTSYVVNVVITLIPKTRSNYTSDVLKTSRPIRNAEDFQNETHLYFELNGYDEIPFNLLPILNK